MNPSTALAQVLVDELVRGGVREVVLSPGSRSASLALALHEADSKGRLRLHVRIDERTGAFLALGLAKRSGRPVPMVTTSGTAAGNLHPAVLEAAEADVPLLLLTADRPPELRDTGANQTVDQVKLYGGAVRMFAEVGVPETRSGQNAYWRALVCRALAAASGALDSDPGPVHLNLALREPLVADADNDWVEPLTGRDDVAPWTQVLPSTQLVTPADDLPARTVVVIGDGRPAEATAALLLAELRGWPVIAEPSAGAAGSNVVHVGDLLLGVPAFLDAHRPDRVLVIGRVTLSRRVGRFVAGAVSDVVGRHGRWADAGRRAHRVLPTVPAPVAGAVVDPSWLPAWLAAGERASRAVADILDPLAGLPEPVVSAELLAVAPAGSLVVVGSSKPVRDLFLAGVIAGITVLANRGAAGIDGVVSTAVGAALAHQRDGGGHAYALLGDLTFLHDATALMLGPAEPRPDLTIVVVNNDGGAIFGMLEQGDGAYESAFERVFGTPHRVDLAHLCAATATPHRRVTTRAELRDALQPGAGIRVVEVPSNRGDAVELDAALRAAVTAAF